MKRILAFILAFALIFPTTAVVACATTGEIVAVVNSEVVSEEASDENVSDENVSDENVSDENVSDENVSDENVSDENGSEDNGSGGSIFENVFNMDTIMDLIETIMAALGNIDFGAILDALTGVIDMILGLFGIGGEEPAPPAETPTPPEEPTTPPTETPTPPTEQTPSVDNSDDGSSNAGSNNSGNTSNNNSNNNVQQSGGTPIEMPLVPTSVWTILVIVVLVIFAILVIVL